MTKPALSGASFLKTMIYLEKSEVKDLLRKTAPGKLICDKAFNTAKISKHDEYWGSFAFMVDNFLIKIQQLAEKLHNRW